MFLYIILFILGLCFGSFSTVLISRWKSGKGGILLGRSECPHCGKTLSAMELIPLFSWVIQGGKCSNCKTPIPAYYPLSEIIMGIAFVCIGFVATNMGYSPISITSLILLFWGFVTVIYIIYDIRYMEIPDQIMVPAIILSLLFLLSGYFGYGYGLFFDYPSYQNFHTFLIDHIVAAFFIYSFFFLQILIPGSIYLIKNNRKKEVSGLFLSYLLFPIHMIIDFFRSKKDDTSSEDDIPVWIGGGDLRIAIFIGLTLGTIHSLSTLMFAYILGSIVGIIILVYGKIKDKKYSSMIPFGPFLGIGWFLSLLFYHEIINYLGIFNI